MLVTGLCLMTIGIWGVLAHRNILRMIISFSLIDSGIHIVIVATGYLTGGTAPIVDATIGPSELAFRSVDPVPSALAVTAIVIGFAVTAIMLAYAVRLFSAKKTLSIDAFTESRW